MKYLVLIFFLIASCSQGETTAVTTLEGLPPGAILTDYNNQLDVQKAIVKAGGVVVEEGDVFNGLKHGSWSVYSADGMIQSNATYFQGFKQGLETLYDNQVIVIS